MIRIMEEIRKKININKYKEELMKKYLKEI